MTASEQPTSVEVQIAQLMARAMNSAWRAGVTGENYDLAGDLDALRPTLRRLLAGAVPDTAGRCGDMGDLLFNKRYCCELRAGHAGWHREGVTEWSGVVARRAAGAVPDTGQAREQILQHDITFGEYVIAVCDAIGLPHDSPRAAVVEAIRAAVAGAEAPESPTDSTPKAGRWGSGDTETATDIVQASTAAVPSHAVLLAAVRTGARRADPLTVRCRECEAPAGETCHANPHTRTSTDGVVVETNRPRRAPHDFRVWTARMEYIAIEVRALLGTDTTPKASDG